MEAVIGALKLFQLQNAHGAQDVYIWKQENKWGSNMFKFKTQPVQIGNPLFRRFYIFPFTMQIFFVQIIAWNSLVIHKSKWFQKPTLHDHIFKRVVTQCRSLVAGMAVMMMMAPHLPGLVQVHGAMMKLIVVSLTPNLVRIHLGFLASVMVLWVIGCWPKKKLHYFILFFGIWIWQLRDPSSYSDEDGIGWAGETSEVNLKLSMLESFHQHHDADGPRDFYAKNGASSSSLRRLLQHPPCSCGCTLPFNVLRKCCQSFWVPSKTAARQACFGHCSASLVARHGP